MDIQSLLIAAGDTEPADQSACINRITLTTPDDLNGICRILDEPTLKTADSPSSKRWRDPISRERLPFWGSIYAKRNPICDVIGYGPLGAYQARNLIQSSFHSGTGLFLLEHELETVTHVGNSLIQRNLQVEFVFQRYWGNCSGQHILGFPNLKFKTWQDACTTFFFYLQSLRDESSSLAQLCRRASQVWFWLFFDILCEQSMQKNDLEGTVVDGNRDVLEGVQHQILAVVYPGYMSAPWGEVCRRALHDHLRCGFRWWKLACSAGFGALLIASDDVAHVVNSSLYSESLLDALINYIRNAYPRALDLFRLCSPIVNRLMQGSKPHPGDIMKVQKCIGLVDGGGHLNRSYCLPWSWTNPGPVAMANSATFVMDCEYKGVISIAHLLD